jgi:hypothetical protein
VAGTITTVPSQLWLNIGPALTASLMMTCMTAISIMILAQTHHTAATSTARKLNSSYFSFQPLNNHLTMHALTAGCIRQRDKQALPFRLHHVFQSVDVSSSSVRCYNFVRNHGIHTRTFFHNFLNLPSYRFGVPASYTTLFTLRYRHYSLIFINKTT